jgi:hypothetical protein
MSPNVSKHGLNIFLNLEKQLENAREPADVQEVRIYESLLIGSLVDARSLRARSSHPTNKLLCTVDTVSGSGREHVVNLVWGWSKADFRRVEDSLHVKERLRYSHSLLNSIQASNH